ncbi:hypothetical protein C8R47DRAFT_1216473 [Mycena vitilis]|nr:hypothetical protein C8R47DRAFT_1216473 [Mycena vitilis]
MVRSARKKVPPTTDNGDGGSHSHMYSMTEVAPEDAPITAHIHRVSNDRRRVHIEELEVDPPSPVKRQRMGERPSEPVMPHVPFAQSAAFEGYTIVNNERYDLDFTNDLDEVPERPCTPTPKVLKKVTPSDKSLSDWRQKRDDYLSALIWRDGRGEHDRLVCPACKGKSELPPLMRCRDCFGDVLYCEACIVARHHENPLHRTQKWEGRFFVKKTLGDLKMRIQVGHTFPERCMVPHAAKTDFVILHTNGIHEVNVDYCGCGAAFDAGAPEVQLLRAGFFPATHERPQTCATLAVLEKFHQDTLQSKMTMYDFYGVLEKLTDNTGIKPPDRYHEWIRMCREFRHLMLLKRGGRALAYSSGVDGTGQGELAIECPACPRPGVNLPDGWEKSSPEERFLYTLYIALDACFRLKRRLISSELKDPDLGSGWAYMVENSPYRDYLRTVTNQKEMNTCSGLAALDYANTKFSRGYSTTGVGMGVCARHEFVQANGVGDLQKGERFANIDYIFACILKHKHPRLFKFISYDIMCIWKVTLVKRIRELPAHVRLFLVLALLRFAIPKMHIHAHTIACQLYFSLNLILGSAQVEGEAIERAWAGIGGVATSTRDMGPGSRHDCLDCQWSYWNWQKLVKLVESLRRRMERAVEELKDQTAAFEEFSSQQRERVPEWRTMVLQFELEETEKNPYEVKISGLTEAQVRLQFTKEEAEDAARGLPSIHDVSGSSFITAGLDLEDEQRRVRVQAELKKAQTTEMQIDLGAMRTKLNKGIARFRKIQASYMPTALKLLGDLALPAGTLAEDVPLLLPSALTEAQRERCVAGVEHVEALMRDAQCRTALVRLRNQLHIKSRLLTYKKNHARHQGANTRSRTIVARNESKIRLHSEKYQMAWEALRKLNGDDPNLVGWRVLLKDDIRCMADEEDLRQKEKERVAKRAFLQKRNQQLQDHGLLPAEVDDDMEIDEPAVGRGAENRRQVSWIWTLAGADGTDAGFEDALRLEWSKAFARTRRWEEERRLLLEEYRRVGVSFEHEARKWEARAAAVPTDIPRAQAEGAIAYVLRHMEMYRDLKVRGEKEWTREKLPRGQKRARHVPAVVGAMEAAEREEREERGERLEKLTEEVDDEDEEARMRGDVESDEEYILGGEGYD